MQKLILIGLVLIIAATAAAQDGYALICDLGDEIEVRLRGAIDSKVTWPGNRTGVEKAMVYLGGWKQHLYMTDNEGDYLWVRFVVADGAVLVLDNLTWLALVYEDGSCLVGEEMIFTDSPKEEERFVTTEESIILTSGPSRYGRSRDCNGFVAAVRFRHGTLLGSGEWGYDLPVRVEILRGSEAMR